MPVPSRGFTARIAMPSTEDNLTWPFTDAFTRGRPLSLALTAPRHCHDIDGQIEWELKKRKEHEPVQYIARSRSVGSVY